MRGLKNRLELSHYLSWLKVASISYFCFSSFRSHVSSRFFWLQACRLSKPLSSSYMQYSMFNWNSMLQPCYQLTICFDSSRRSHGTSNSYVIPCTANIFSCSIPCYSTHACSCPLPRAVRATYAAVLPCLLSQEMLSSGCTIDKGRQEKRN